MVRRERVESLPDGQLARLVLDDQIDRRHGQRGERVVSPVNARAPSCEHTRPAVLARRAAQLATGKRPRVRNLLLTPKNAMRLTTQLAEMRGAAMKLGQILSMDTGDLLPQELADILATLRNAGYAMPDAQLQEVLADGLGPNFEKKLKEKKNNGTKS